METACIWEWLGIAPWDKLEDTCVSPSTCVAPTGDGNYYGEKREVGCSVE